MINEIETHKNWTHFVITDDQNKLKALYILHNRIVENEYPHDVIIIDDTACTNYYALPLVALIAVDENYWNELLSFALIDSREQISFINYFQKLKEVIGDIRVFVTDRNLSQINRIKMYGQMLL